MNITEKILAKHSSQKEVHAGEFIDVKLDTVFSSDVTAPIALAELSKMGYEEVFDKDKVYFIMDHFVPCSDKTAATACKYVRDFAKKTDMMDNFYDVGRMGIQHALLPEQGIVLPGQVIVGGDSHTCTYGALGAFSTGMGSTDIAAAMAMGELWFKVPEAIKFVYKGKLPKYITGKDLILHTIGKIGVDGALYKTMEFTGEAIHELSMDGRFTMCNMAIEAGAKNGIIAPDEKTRAYVEQHNQFNKEVCYYESDKDAKYAMEYEFDVSDLQPQVAFPHLPSNAKDVSAGHDIAIDQVIIGSCTNGRIEDLRAAASLLKGKHVHPYVRTIVIPATNEIYRQAMQEGLLNIFLDAGAVISTPTCGPCFGGYMGILASGERVLSTTNRNFVGRMGAIDSEVYLSSPYVAAASAIKGYITHPEEVE